MILLDPRDRRPIYEQITEKLSQLILRGILSPGETLPSVRNLAADLSINPNTVQRAYLLLEQQGYIHSVKGKGSTVADVSGLRAFERVKTAEELSAKLLEAKEHGMTRDEVLDLLDRIYGNEKGEMHDQH